MLSYCVLMADVCGLDLDEILNAKVDQNAAKYPVEKAAEGEIDILTLLVKCGLAASKGEARRLVQQGGVTVCGQKVADIEARFSCKDCCGEGAVIKKGKKVYHKAVLEEP